MTGDDLRARLDAIPPGQRAEEQVPALLRLALRGLAELLDRKENSDVG